MSHSLLDFVRDLGKFGAMVEITRHEVLEEACQLVEKEAKDVIGEYRAGYNWPQLAQSTQEERARLGYPPNEPLLREGDLRASIEHTVAWDAGYVGSNSKIAVYQELGTSKIPPRPFLGGAAAAKEKEVLELGAKAAKRAALMALK